MTGTVVSFDRDRGFGFVRPRGEQQKRRGADVFVHIKSFQRDENGQSPVIEKGDEIEFIIGESERRPGAMQAFECVLLNQPSRADVGAWD